MIVIPMTYASGGIHRIGQYCHGAGAHTRADKNLWT